MNLLKRVVNRAQLIRDDLFPEFRADGLAVARRNLRFLDDLAPAWAAVERAHEGLAVALPDIRWRAAIALWAARHAMRLEGDLVECGVFTGILSTVICHAIPDLGERRFFLCDTYEGIPVETVSAEERRNAEGLNANYYARVDAEAVVRRAVGHVPQVKIVKGMLPGSLPLDEIAAIAYLSIDLNNVAAEMAVADALWPRLTPGAVVVLDDFGFSGHERQHEAWMGFAAREGVPIAPLPTGQGLIIKPPPRT